MITLLGHNSSISRSGSECEWDEPYCPENPFWTLNPLLAPRSEGAWKEGGEDYKYDPNSSSLLCPCPLSHNFILSSKAMSGLSHELVFANKIKWNWCVSVLNPDLMRPCMFLLALFCICHCHDNTCELACWRAFTLRCRASSPQLSQPMLVYIDQQPANPQTCE